MPVSNCRDASPHPLMWLDSCQLALLRVNAGEAVKGQPTAEAHSFLTQQKQATQLSYGRGQKCGTPGELGNKLQVRHPAVADT